MSPFLHKMGCTESEIQELKHQRCENSQFTVDCQSVCSCAQQNAEFTFYVTEAFNANTFAQAIIKCFSFKCLNELFSP